ncbi:hypothetical protein BH10ACI1_BH10ACI1_09660 [soil metagenome]
MAKRNLIIILCVFFSTALGCRTVLRQFQSDFLSGNSAQTAAQAVKSKIGSSFKVQEVEITANEFKMKVEDPNNPQNIDEYTYLGFFVSDPQPVQRDAMTKSRDKLPFDQIDFTLIPQIVQKALDKTQIEGGKVKRMTLQAHDGQTLRWFVEIQGTRESASAFADIAGNITSTDMSQTSKAANYKILSETELNKAANAIKTKFGETAQFQKLTISETSVGVEVINPQNSKVVDAYTYGIDGLKKSVLPQLPANTMNEPFSFNTINLTDAVGLAQKAKERLSMPNGQVFSIAIEQQRDFVENKSQRTWAVWIKQGVSQGTVKYDSKLNEISIKKD